MIETNGKRYSGKFMEAGRHGYNDIYFINTVYDLYTDVFTFKVDVRRVKSEDNEVGVTNKQVTHIVIIIVWRKVEVNQNIS